MIRFGLAAWSNKHFDHILYPLRTLHKEYLPRYASVFPVVEADILHHQVMDEETLHQWVEQTPDGFRFLPKLHKDATHPDEYGDAAIEAAEEAHRSMDVLRDADRLGPTLAQFPKSFRRDEGTAEWLARFLRTAPAQGLAIEFRHPSWFVPETESALRRAGVALCWGTFEPAIAPAWDTAPFRYVRFIGTTYKQRDRWVTQKDRLDVILDMRERLHGHDAFAIVTNRFEGHALDSFPRIAAALGDEALARRLSRKPMEPLFPTPPDGQMWGTQGQPTDSATNPLKNPHAQRVVVATTLYTLDVPDEPGTLGRVAGIMNDAGINIDAFAAGKGGLRIITGADTDTAGALQAAGITFTATEVIEIELPNQPGALAGVAKALGDHGVNIETSFGAAKGQDGGSIYIGVDDVDKAWEALEAISTA